MAKPVVHALTRAVGPGLARCELTHLARVPIDVERAASQHRAYETALAGLGCRVTRLPPAPEHPDAVFVEDTAVVLDELAVIARPGAPSRRTETASVAPVLARYRALAALEAPATLDGGSSSVARPAPTGRASRRCGPLSPPTATRWRRWRPAAAST